MIRSILLLVVIAVALGAAGCKPAPEGTTPAAPTTAPAPTPAPPPSPAVQQPATGAGFEEIVVTVEIPVEPLAEEEPAQPAGSHGGSRCPMSESGTILGIVIGVPHGIIVSKVLPDGPAAKAGIKVGDSIVACNGVKVSCPSALRPMLDNNGSPLTVKLTIHRAKKAAASPAGGAAPK